MAAGDDELYESLKEVLFHDNAVAGEAAGIAMVSPGAFSHLPIVLMFVQGLVLLGAGSDRSEAVDEMLAYAHDTQHEKIIRGLALGLALVMSGREEQSDFIADTLLDDKDSNLRYGGCYMLALAYAATANNSAVHLSLLWFTRIHPSDARHRCVACYTLR